MLHPYGERLAGIFLVFQEVEDFILNWREATNPIVLLPMQVVQLFLLLRLQLGPSIHHEDELLHAQLLFNCQIAFDIFVFLKQEGQLFFLCGRHGILEQAHCEIAGEQGFLLRRQTILLLNMWQRIP